MATQKQINLMAYKEWVKPEDISKRIWTIAPWALAMDKNGSYGIDFKKDLYDYSKAPESTEWGLVLDGAVVKRPTTNKPLSAEEQQFNILPESVTWVKPYISPTLQAKIDSKKTPVTPVQTTPAPVTTEEVVTPVVEPIKPVETKPVEVAPVLTDVEKQAQATGVKYAMVNGLPEYEPTNKEEALKILQSGGKFSAENGMTAVAKANLDKYRKYAQMTDTQLAQNIVNGNVSSRELEQITSINPDLVAKAKDMARKSTITDTANTIQVANDSIVKGEDTQVQNKALTNLLTKLADLDANAESYGDIKARVYANYPDMEVARGEIVNAQTQLRQLQRAKRDIFDDYKKKNSSLPISMIVSGYSALSKEIDDQIYAVNDTLSQNVALYNSYLDEAKSEIDWEVGNQEKQEQRLFDLYGVTSKEEIRQEDFARADKLLADELARADKADVAKIKQLEQERLDNVKEAIAKLGVEPVGETYDELLGEYATAVKNQPKEEKITTGLKAGDFYMQDGELKQVPEGGGIGGNLGDLRPLAWQYPNEASFKNNNPAGFTVNNAFQQFFDTWVAPAGSTADIWSKAWIQFWPWALRPSWEGGKYVQFPTIDEGLKAMRLWWDTRNNTIDDQLKSFSAAGYKLPWFEGKKFSELSEEQKNQFLMTQIKKESPWLSRVLSQQQAQKSDPYLQAFNVLAFDKPTLQKQEQKVLQDLISSGNEAQVRTKLENLASNNIEGAPEKTAYQQTRTLVSSLDKVRQTLDKLKAKRVNTGLLKGKYEDIANKFGKVWDPEIAKLGVTLRDQLDALRRARSGAALTEFEEKFYDSIFPSAGKSYDLNVAGLEGLLDSRKALKNSYLQNAYGDDLFNTIWGEKQAPENTTEYKGYKLPWTVGWESNVWGYKWYKLPNQ
jgi:hypothetical protein